MVDGAALAIIITSIGIAVGALIGGVGVGGVLLAPALDITGSTSVHGAIPICMLVFVFSGLVGTAIYARRKVVSWPVLGPLSAGACPAAFAGAIALAYVPTNLVKAMIAAVVIGAGIQAVRKTGHMAAKTRTMSTHMLIVLGALVGFGSSLTGTGGPLILLPILMFAGVNVLQAVGLAQAIQIPIGIFATASNLMMSRIDLELGAWLTVTVVIGVYVGANFIHTQAPDKLRYWIGPALILAGAVYGGATLSMS